MKAISGIVRVLSWIVYVVIIVALLIAAPILFGNRPVVILSGSMEPAYPVGSIIYYKSAEFSDIQADDAITFKIGDDSLATHRVVSVDTDAQSFITKGDNNPTEDPEPVTYDRVVGKASDFAIPYAGYFTQYMQNWWAIGIMGLILLADMLLSVKKKKSADNKIADGEGEPRSHKYGRYTDKSEVKQSPKASAYNNGMADSGATRHLYGLYNTKPEKWQSSNASVSNGIAGSEEVHKSYELYTAKPEEQQTRRTSAKRKSSTSAEEFFKDI